MNFGTNSNKNSLVEIKSLEQNRSHYTSFLQKRFGNYSSFYLPFSNSYSHSFQKVDRQYVHPVNYFQPQETFSLYQNNPHQNFFSIPPNYHNSYLFNSQYLSSTSAFLSTQCAQSSSLSKNCKMRPIDNYMPNNDRKRRKKWQIFPGRNRFYCDGKIMMSKQISVFYFALILLILTCTLFFIFE